MARFTTNPHGARAKREYTFCEDCNRVLYKEDGPVCPECQALRAEAQLEEAIETIVEVENGQAAEGEQE